MKLKGLMRWRTAGLLGAMLIIVGLPYFVTVGSSRDTKVAGQLVAHSNAVQAMAYQIAYLLRDSEAATYRLFAGDDDAATRERAVLAVDHASQLLSQLRAMTRDNPDQQARIGALETAVNGHVTLMNQAVARLSEGNLAGARQSLRDADDLFKVNGAIAGIVKSEDLLLQQRHLGAEEKFANAKVVLGLTALTQLLLLFIIVLASEQQIGRRLLAEAGEDRAVQRSQLILQAMREPIALFDENLDTLLINNAFRELYKLDEDDVSRPLRELGDGVWNDAALLQRLNDVLLRDRELWDYELVQVIPEEAERHVVVNARRLQETNTDVPALLMTVSDVTARALSEQKVNDLNRQLEGKVSQISDVNRELEAFSYSVSHDLRAPLRHVAGFGRKLQQQLGEDVDEKSAHYLDVIIGSAQRMAVLIDDLLVFSRLGRGPLRLQAVDMQSLVEEAKTLAQTGLEDRRIVWDIAPLPMVIGDENMLRTVWQNLLGNAVKYTGQCEVARISVKLEQNRRGDYEFTVSDNGAGFDMQYADKLFGVFQRLHRASEFPGNGIGLANVRRIVTRHGGKVWAEAEPDKGAHFHFSLPATDAAGAHI